jgi:hypothetical protein
MRCQVVLLEAAYGTPGEVADAIGWWQRHGSETVSVLVECKASRRDFLKDREKPFRGAVGPGGGMGALRYYLVPRGLVGAEEVPEGWGLLELKGNGVSVAVEAPGRIQSEASLKAELRLLVGAMTRVQHRENGWIFDEDTKHAYHNLGLRPRRRSPDSPRGRAGGAAG